MAAPKKVDYDRIEPGWRAGILSPAQLAAAYTEDTGVSVSHAAVIKHFKKAGIPRDLKAKVHAKADAMVMASMVTGKVSSETINRDAQIIADNAIAIATVRLTHRTDIARARRLVMVLLEEVETLTGNRDLLDQLEEVFRGEGDNPLDRRREVYAKVISSAGRIDSMKKLSETLRTLVTLEREAYGMADRGEAPPPPNPLQFLQNTTVVIQDAVTAAVQRLEAEY